MRRLLLLTVLLSATTILAQTPRDVAVEVEAKVIGKSFVLSWPSDSRATAYQVYRRDAGSTSWGTGKALPAGATAYTDTTLVAGKQYEFRVRKSIVIGNDSYAWGYVYGGIDILQPNYQGTLILVVDDAFAEDLKVELSRLSNDLENDGWSVRRLDVKRAWSPVQVKDSIFDIYNQDPSAVKALFLFGHVPVPYSGMIVPDGHINNHLAPWPADAYYGDDAEWTDDVDYDTMLVFQNGQGGFDTVPIPQANRNFAGDGRFDPSEFPDAIDLMVGRVDLANMPAFARSELELLRQYLNKDHAYRTGTLSAPLRGLIDDNFGYFSGTAPEAFASSGWRAFSQLVGRDSIKDNGSSAANDWFTTLSSQPYVWAYGCGGGTFTSAGGIGTTTDFATKPSKAIFTMLFGSYFGDWNVTNNFLRAPLASEYGLSCAWSGRPYWYFHPMAIGKSLGFCARLTQNNYSGSYASGPTSPTSIHVALMGDPTLRMHPLAPPTNLAVLNVGLNKTSLSWKASTDASIDSYYVYKAHQASGPFYLTGSVPAGTTAFDDTFPFLGRNAYMVHAMKKEITPAGSYFNLSAASRATIEGVVAGVEVPMTSALFSAVETGLGTELTIGIAKEEQVTLAIYNQLGVRVSQLEHRSLGAGTYHYTWSTTEKDRQPDGVYFAVATIGGKSEVRKIINIR